MINFKARSLTTCLAGLAMTSFVLQAASMAVTPVRVELSPQHIHTSLQVSNEGDRELTVQVHAITWEHGASDDTPAETQDLVINPPIFTLSPRQSQTMRIGLRRYDAKFVEQTYRLILEEVPTAILEGFGMRSIMRVSIPIFCPPSGRSEPALTWELISSGLMVDESDTLDRQTLRVENHGNTHVQLKQLSVIAVDTKELIFTAAMSAYVLPGERRDFPLSIPLQPKQGKLLLRAETDRGSTTEHLTLH